MVRGFQTKKIDTFWKFCPTHNSRFGRNRPMDTSLSIRYRFGIEIPRRTSVDILSIITMISFDAITRRRFDFQNPRKKINKVDRIEEL